MKKENILNFLYPRCCPMCHEILRDQMRLICPECEKKLQPLSGPRCMKCGKPVGKEVEYCKDCEKSPRTFTEGKGIFLYNDRWRLSLEKYKYYGCREYGDFYAKAMFVFAGREIRSWKPDKIVPIPLHRKKEKMRGFNQSAYLAEKLSSFTGIPCDSGLMKKIRNTKSQKKLNAEERRRNLKGAFTLSEEVRGKSILLIDDVYTTGSTMEEAAVCLMAGGAQKVYFLTVCTGNQ